VVSALRARANFGRLLRRVDDERRSLVIEKRGSPKAVLLSIRDYVKLAAPEPEVLRHIVIKSLRGVVHVEHPVRSSVGTTTISLCGDAYPGCTAPCRKPR
jgi:prevent-host-death family protein